MHDFSRLLFLPLNMPAPPDISDRLDMLTQDDNNIILDSYRISPSIMLMNRNGVWHENANGLDDFKNWAETSLFPWTARSQIVVIITPAHKSMAPHIDCSPQMFNTWQHKFRYVFRGRVDTLRYFMKNSDVTVHQTDKPYIISGKWPHDMHNNFNQTKYTLCLGAPWEATPDNKKYIDMLEKSYQKNKELYLSFDENDLPDNFVDFFDKKLYPDAYKFFKQ